PTVIGVTVNPAQPIAVAVKLRLVGAAKSLDVGLKTNPERLGGTRYTVPVLKPGCVQTPGPLVSAAAGTGAPPAATENVMGTPDTPTELFVTVPATAYCVVGSPRVSV